MPDLHFNVQSARPAPSPPGLSLDLEITNTSADEQVHSIALTVQLQVEPARRRYSGPEMQALGDLFGEPARWGMTVRPLFWTTVNAVVPAFIGSTHFDLQIPGGLEPDLAAAKYFRGLEDGEVPVTLLFSGRVLYVNNNSLQMAPIPWTLEASYRIPVQLLKNLVDIAGSRTPRRGVAWT